MCEKKWLLGNRAPLGLRRGWRFNWITAHFLFIEAARLRRRACRSATRPNVRPCDCWCRHESLHPSISVSINQSIRPALHFYQAKSIRPSIHPSMLCLRSSIHPATSSNKNPPIHPLMDVFRQLHQSAHFTNTYI